MRDMPLLSYLPIYLFLSFFLNHLLFHIGTHDYAIRFPHKYKSVMAKIHIYIFIKVNKDNLEHFTWCR